MRRQLHPIHYCFFESTCSVFRGYATMTLLTHRSNHSHRMLLGALLGLMALSATPGKAAAQTIPVPLDMITNTVGSVLGLGQSQTPQTPPELDVFNDNIRNNDLDICVLTCTPSPIPLPQTARGPVPPRPGQARPSSAARPPVRTSGSRPPASPTARPQSNPTGPTILVPPIQL